jgi:hypothetical protein
MLQAGDIVKLKHNPNGRTVTGIIDVVIPGPPDKYRVKYDDTNLVPPAMEHTSDELEIWDIWNEIGDIDDSDDISEIDDMFGMFGQLPVGDMNEHLEDALREHTENKTKCECGIESIGGALHSSWCPKAEQV